MRYLLIALLLFVNTVQAAPVPRERQQTEQTQFREADLYGTWMFEWGIILDTGFITFYKDGTFFYKHDVNGPICHCGTWTITNDVLNWSILRGRPQSIAWVARTLISTHYAGRDTVSSRPQDSPSCVSRITVPINSTVECPAVNRGVLGSNPGSAAWLVEQKVY
jgi:hypothetical protein